jgi:hypothetical protein
VKITEYEPGGTKYVNPDAADDWASLHLDGKGRIAYLFGHPSVSAADTVAFFKAELTAVRLRTNSLGVYRLHHDSMRARRPGRRTRPRRRRPGRRQ